MKRIAIINNLPAKYDDALEQVGRVWRIHGWQITTEAPTEDALRVRIALVSDATYNRDWIGKHTRGLRTDVIEINNRYDWVGRDPSLWRNLQFWKPRQRDIRPILAHEIGHAFGLGHNESHRSIMDQFSASSLPWQSLRFPFATP
jgi:hypothetical protein